MQISARWEALDGALEGHVAGVDLARPLVAAGKVGDDRLGDAGELPIESTRPWRAALTLAHDAVGSGLTESNIFGVHLSAAC